jgi:hypothetical protein
MFHGQERRKGFWIKRAIFIPIAIVAGVFIFGSVVMLLWNALLPAVFGFKVITFWQALGLLVLSKILFGGFRGGHGHHRFHGHMQSPGSRFMHLSPEEREKMRSEWRGRCEPLVKQE